MSIEHEVNSEQNLKQKQTAIVARKQRKKTSAVKNKKENVSLIFIQKNKERKIFSFENGNDFEIE